MPHSGIIAGDKVERLLDPNGYTIESIFRQREIDFVRILSADGATSDEPLAVAESWHRVGEAPTPAESLNPDLSWSQLAPSSELADRLKTLIYSPDRSWSAFLAKLVPVVEAWGYDLWVAGGAVRDILTGKDPREVKDLDLAGTVPPVRMQRIMQGIIEHTPAFVQRTLHVRHSPQDIVHLGSGPLVLEAATQRVVPVYDSFLQYCPLRDSYRPVGGGQGHRWHLGADLIKDQRFRDVSLNALFYDVVRNTIVVPTQQSLTDLGLKHQTAVESWCTDQARGAATIRPFELVSRGDVPSSWAIKGLARVLKAMQKFPDADCHPISQWFADHQVRIGEELRENVHHPHHEPVNIGEAKLASFIKEASIDIDEGLLERCQGLGFPPDLLDLLERVTPRAHVGGVDDGPLTGWGLGLLEESDGVLTLGDAVMPDLRRLNPSNVNALLLPVIGGRGEPVGRDVRHRGVLMRARVIGAPAGLFVELDAGGEPLSTDGLS